MPRISYIDDSRKTPQVAALIESAQKTGAPDPRVVSIMTRSEVGTAWVECWNKVLYKGVLPHKLKEMCRIKISVAHQCGYCSTVRSNVAKGEGLTEEVINELGSYQTSGYFLPGRKLRCRRSFPRGGWLGDRGRDARGPSRDSTPLATWTAHETG